MSLCKALGPFNLSIGLGHTENEPLEAASQSPPITVLT
jgi:hypothetical protein